MCYTFLGRRTSERFFFTFCFSSFPDFPCLLHPFFLSTCLRARSSTGVLFTTSPFLMIEEEYFESRCFPFFFHCLFHIESSEWVGGIVPQRERRKQGKPVIKSEDYIIIWEIKGHILFFMFLFHRMYIR